MCFPFNKSVIEWLREDLMINAVSKYSFGAAGAYGVTAQAIDKEQKTYTQQMQQPQQDTFVKKTKDHRNFWERHLAAIIAITSIGFLAVAIKNGKRARASEERFQREFERMHKSGLKPGNGKYTDQIFENSESIIQKFERTSSSPRNFNDVIGMDEEKQKLKRLILNPIQSKETRKIYIDEYGLNMPSGILLEGAPGNGKTFLVEALAGELDTSLYKLKMSDLGSKYIHETGENISKMINEIKEKAQRSEKPVILFLDELDGLARARTGGSNSNELEELNTILQNINNLQDHNVILIGATNRKDLIDNAILRPGRFGEHIFVKNPDEKAVKEMLKSFLGKKNKAKEFLGKESEVDEITKKLNGFSNAEVKDIIDNSARLAFEDKQANINRGHIETAINNFRDSRKQQRNPIGFKPNNS